MTIDVFSAFIIGLLGAGHCIGMCGGITTLFSAASGKAQQSQLSLILHYNLGRILTYTLVGTIAGLTGSLAIKSSGLGLGWLRIVSSILLILLGLYIGKWFFLLNKIEKIGKFIWPKIQPLTKHLLPVNTKTRALLFGCIWGWLPCGLVYSTLTWSLASGDIITGGLIMLFFGLGTLPAMISTSISTNLIKQLLNNPYFRSISAFSLIIYGLYSLQIAYSMVI